MGADTLKIFLWIVSLVITGRAILYIVFRKEDLFFRWESMALSYGLGTGAVTIVMACMSAAGLRFNPFTVMSLLAPVILAGFIMAGNGFFKLPKRASKRKPLSAIEKFFIAVIAFEMAYAVFRALIKPLESFDAMAIYGLKSKIFYLQGVIHRDFFTCLSDFVPHIEYPLLMPLAETYFYTCIGSLNDWLVKLIFPLYYFAMLAVFYSVSRRFFERKTALLFLFLLATIPQFKDYAVNGYADLPVTFYYSAGLFYILLWWQKKDSRFLILSFVLSVFAAWTKPEGLLLMGVNVFAVFVAASVSGRSFFRNAVIYAAAFILLAGVFSFLRKLLGLGMNSDFAVSGWRGSLASLSNINRIPRIFYEYQRQFFGPKKWNILWILLLAGFMARFKRSFGVPLRVITLSILLILAFYTYIYMATTRDLGWHLSTSASRLFIHLVPASVLWLAFLYKEEGMEI